jgi:hypothetical protein
VKRRRWADGNIKSSLNLTISATTLHSGKRETLPRGRQRLLRWSRTTCSVLSGSIRPFRPERRGKEIGALHQELLQSHILEPVDLTPILSSMRFHTTTSRYLALSNQTIVPTFPSIAAIALRNMLGRMVRRRRTEMRTAATMQTGMINPTSMRKIHGATSWLNKCARGE